MPRRINWIGLALAVIGTAACGRSEPLKRAGETSAPAANVAGTSPAALLQLARGQATYDKFCVQCHGADLKGYVADNAPSLVSPTFLASADADFLRAAIETGRPDTAMGAYASARGGPLGPADVNALIRLILSRRTSDRATLAPPAPGNVQRGQAVYDATCRKCHGDATTRVSALSIVNPAFLASASDDFLTFAVRKGRPGTPMEGFGSTLSDEQIGDVVQYLRAQQPGAPATASGNSNIGVAALKPKSDAKMPVILNPKGRAPTFTLREDRFVSVDQVKAALDGKRRLVLVDARPASEWSAERVAGAISIPYYQLDGVSRLPTDGTWVVAYCGCPHHLSGMVVDELLGRGFTHAAVLDEGIAVWKQRGYPVAGQLARVSRAVSRGR